LNSSKREEKVADLRSDEGRGFGVRWQRNLRERVDPGRDQSLEGEGDLKRGETHQKEKKGGGLLAFAVGEAHDKEKRVQGERGSLILRANMKVWGGTL